MSISYYYFFFSAFAKNRDEKQRYRCLVNLFGEDEIKKEGYIMVVIVVVVGGV